LFQGSLALDHKYSMEKVSKKLSLKRKREKSSPDVDRLRTEKHSSDISIPYTADETTKQCQKAPSASPVSECTINSVQQNNTLGVCIYMYYKNFGI